MELEESHHGFLSWVQEGRVVLHRGHVCLSHYRMQARKRVLHQTPLNTSMYKLYTDLVVAGFITEATAESPSQRLDNPGVSSGSEYDAIFREYKRRCRSQGFPWCDTCQNPAVYREGAGYLHSTPDRPYGLFEDQDPSRHAVTVKEWFKESGLESHD